MEGTNKAHENGEAMGLVGVRLTAQLGDIFWPILLGLLLFTCSLRTPNRIGEFGPAAPVLRLQIELRIEAYLSTLLGHEKHFALGWRLHNLNCPEAI